MALNLYEITVPTELIQSGMELSCRVMAEDEDEARFFHPGGFILHSYKPMLKGAEATLWWGPGTDDDHTWVKPTEIGLLQVKRVDRKGIL